MNIEDRKVMLIRQELRKNVKEPCSRFVVMVSCFLDNHIIQNWQELVEDQ